MPIYEFQCRNCTATFEILQLSAARSEAIACSRCGSTEVKKAISATACRLGERTGGASALPSSGCSSKGGFS